MKFNSRKDRAFYFAWHGVTLLCLGCIIFPILMQPDATKLHIASGLILCSVIGLLCWIAFDTRYELIDGYLKYRSGPFRGKIAIDKIKEIKRDSTLWVGFRPATAKNGLIIKHSKYDEIYISPKINDAFVEEILKLNGEIKISAG